MSRIELFQNYVVLLIVTVTVNRYCYYRIFSYHCYNRSFSYYLSSIVYVAFQIMTLFYGVPQEWVCLCSNKRKFIVVFDCRGVISLKVIR